MFLEVKKAIEAIDFLSGKVDVGENPVVIGGGLTGCEIAYELCLKGKKPTIVEMKKRSYCCQRCAWRIVLTYAITSLCITLNPSRNDG